jgi:hypothetical protein
MSLAGAHRTTLPKGNRIPDLEAAFRSMNEVFLRRSILLTVLRVRLQCLHFRRNRGSGGNARNHPSEDRRLRRLCVDVLILFHMLIPLLPPRGRW